MEVTKWLKPLMCRVTFGDPAISALGRLLPASRCPPTVGKLIHSSLPASAHLRAGVGQKEIPH